MAPHLGNQLQPLLPPRGTLRRVCAAQLDHTLRRPRARARGGGGREGGRQRRADEAKVEGLGAWNLSKGWGCACNANANVNAGAAAQESGANACACTPRQASHLELSSQCALFVVTQAPPVGQQLALARSLAARLERGKGVAWVGARVCVKRWRAGWLST